MIRFFERLIFVLFFIIFIIPMIAEFLVRFCCIPFCWLATGRDGFEVALECRHFFYSWLQKIGDWLDVDFEL